MKSLTSLELESFLKIARKHSERDGLMFQVIFNHGLRISEALALTASNIVDRHLVDAATKGQPQDCPAVAAEREGRAPRTRKRARALLPDAQADSEAAYAGVLSGGGHSSMEEQPA